MRRPVKAAVANHVVAGRPEEAGAAVRVIETASRGALAEMRQMLGILRTGSHVGTGTGFGSGAGTGSGPGSCAGMGTSTGTGNGAGTGSDAGSGAAIAGGPDGSAGRIWPNPARDNAPSGSPASGSPASESAMPESPTPESAMPASPMPASPTPESLAPTPSLADLDRLAEQAEQAGLRITVWLDGVNHLPDALGLTVYRIVQEALTNAAKYAAPAACRVTVRAADGELTVEILDDGRHPGGKVTPGYGLIGMRERVALFGGTLTADHVPTGGFRVAARLPYGAVR